VTANGEEEHVDATSMRSNLQPRSPSVRKEVPQYAFLLIPASDSGKDFGEQAKQVRPELVLVNVPGQSDLMFCREQIVVPPEEVERLLHSCRSAYRELASVPLTSPHARFDIQDWTPLDP
jgi:hypothetical protein